MQVEVLEFPSQKKTSRAATSLILLPVPERASNSDSLLRKTRLLMKFFKTYDMAIINECLLYLCCDLPSTLIAKRSVKLTKNMHPAQILCAIICTLFEL